MKEAFTARNFQPASLEVIATANEICADYRRQGFNLTLRQLYYQFVSRDLIQNHQRSYKRLGSIVNDARLAGLIDWGYIQDRTRNVSGNFAGWGDPSQYVASALDPDGYYEALWDTQDYRPEVWVEKDALVDVVGRAARQHRVPYFSCRGYVSQSEMYDAAKRMQKRWLNGHQPVVIHLGDHDPSGIDMTRDIEDRLSLMAKFPVRVDRIALNMDQIEQYNPPPNFAKDTDARAQDYIARFGEDSWELDALEPSVLVDLITEKVDSFIDHEAWDVAETEQEENREVVAAVSRRWPEIEQYLRDNPESEED